MKGKYHISTPLIWITLALSVLPSLLTLMGVDFSAFLGKADLGYISTLNSGEQVDELHYLLRGRFIHVLISSISIGVAFMTIILAFVDYAIKRDISTPILGVALFCAGILDVFHILCSSRILHLSVGTSQITSFTWLISRSFNALVLILGVSIFPLFYRDLNVENQGNKNKFVYTITTIFILLTVLVIQLIFITSSMPKIIFPDEFIYSPYDFLLFIVYLIIAVGIFPRFYKLNPSFFSLTLFLSLIPAMAAQLHISLGSKEIFDTNFFIAHYLKMLSYFIPFIGLSLNYLQTHRNENRVINMLNTEIYERRLTDETLQGVLNSSLSGIQVYRSVRDEKGRIHDFQCVLSNPAAEKITSFPTNTFLEKTLLEIYPDHAFIDAYIHMVETGEPVAYEYNTPVLNKWIYLVAVKMGDGFTTTFTDITSRKEAEEQLRESQHFIQQIADATPDLLYVYDLQGNKNLYRNRNIYQLLDYQIDETSEMSPGNNLVHPDDIAAVSQHFKNICRSPKDEIFEIEYRMRDSKGNWRWFSARDTIFKRDRNGRTLQLIGTSQDITERKTAAENLLRSERLYREMARNMPDSVVFLYDKELTITLADGSAMHTLGLEKEKVVGYNARQVFKDRSYSILAGLFQKVLSGEECTIEQEIADRYFNIQVLPVKDSQGQIFAGLCVAHDITEVKRYQQVLELRIEELNRSNTDLEQFAYVASHDLQEPLRKIQAFGDRLALKYQQLIDGDGLVYIERMQHASARMQVLIDDLLAFSRLSRNRDPFMPTDLNLLIEEVLKDLEISIESKEASVRIGALPTLPVVPGQMRQLLQNLLSNAIKFSKPGKQASIEVFSRLVHGKDAGKGARLHPDEEYYNIYIRDNGIGFDEKYLDRIFVIFQRLHGRNEFEGTGIGLAICKKVVEHHNGAITAHSIPGEGSTFIITLPLKQKTDEAEKIQKAG